MIVAHNPNNMNKENTYERLVTLKQALLSLLGAPVDTADISEEQLVELVKARVKSRDND